MYDMTDSHFLNNGGQQLNIDFNDVLNGDRCTNLEFLILGLQENLNLI